MLAGTVFFSFAPVLTDRLLAADRWSDIRDQDWETIYGISAEQVASVADGYPDGTFLPYTPVTRAQFAKMAVKGFGLPVLEPTSPSFTDVSRQHPLYAYIETARAAGIVGGFGDGTFRPDAVITRQQANSILGRLLSDQELQAMGVIWGLQLTYPSLQAWSNAESSFFLGVFEDRGAVDPIHRAGTAYLVYHHVVRGSLISGPNERNQFWLKPLDSLARAQAVAMVLRTLAAVEEVAPGAPPAPWDLSTLPASPSSEQRPWITGKAAPGGTVMVYDTFGGSTQLIAQGLAHDMSGDFSVRVSEPMAEGLHQLSLKVRNTKGILSGFSATLPYLVDRTPPTADVTRPLPDSFMNVSRPSFHVDASDQESGVLDVTFLCAPDNGQTPSFQPVSIDYSPPYEASWGALELPEGRYIFQAVVRDRAGNATYTDQVAVLIDLTPPVLTFASPLPQAPGEPVLTEERSPEFRAIAVDPPLPGDVASSGVAGVQFLYAPKDSLPLDPTVGAFTVISDETIPVSQNTYLASWDDLELEDGVYVLACVAMDRAGNSTPLLSQILVVDTEAPEVQIGAPLQGEVITGGALYKILWVASDTYFPTGPVGPITIAFFNGSDWFPLGTGLANTGSFDWYAPAPESDLTQCYLRVSATDAFGRTSTAQSGPFTILPPGP